MKTPALLKQIRFLPRSIDTKKNRKLASDESSKSLGAIGQQKGVARQFFSFFLPVTALIDISKNGVRAHDCAPLPRLLGRGQSISGEV
jgi:hypothetical protein